jgi:hypothetical protein
LVGDVMQNPAILYELAVQTIEADHRRATRYQRRVALDAGLRRRLGWSLVGVGLRLATTAGQRRSLRPSQS